MLITKRIWLILNCIYLGSTNINDDYKLNANIQNIVFLNKN